MADFLFGYAGNKRNEYKEIKNIIKLDNIKTIIEPFCGTSAISYKIYLENGDKFKYILNDNDEFLIKLYKMMKETDINIFIEEVNKTKDLIKDKLDYVKMCKKKDKNLYEWFIMNKYYTIRRGLYNKDIHKNKYKITDKQLKFIDFIKKSYVEIYNNDWIEIFNKYKNDNTNYIFFDPPYLQSCNYFYNNPDLNIYEYFNKNNVKNFKCLIMFILESNWIIKLLFKDEKIITYNKKYELSKKNTQHLAIINY